MNSFTALSLKIVGLVLIVSSFLDYLTLAFPGQWDNRQWQINLAVQIVDRGIVPLVGIGFILLGYAIGETVGRDSEQSLLKLPVFIVSTILGIVFLLLIPLHISNLSQVSSDALATISQKAGEVEQQMQAQYDQLNRLSQNPEDLKKATAELDQRVKQIEAILASGQQIPPEEKAKLEQAKAQFQELRTLVSSPVKLKQRKDELQTKLAEQRSERENQAKKEIFQQGLKVGLNSVILAIAYTFIGWSGIRNSQE
jgi:septal ring factor EnvC (AmiA/AmiB activator)